MERPHGEITIDDFAKVDVRVGTITRAEPFALHARVAGGRNTGS